MKVKCSEKYCPVNKNGYCTVETKRLCGSTKLNQQQINAIVDKNTEDRRDKHGK